MFMTIGEKMPKKTAEEQRSLPFPDCARDCAAVEHFGVGECEDVCPYKFDDDGDPKPSWSSKVEEKYWNDSSEVDLGILGDTQEDDDLHTYPDLGVLEDSHPDLGILGD